MSIIQVEDVSMRFNLAQEKTETLKEYAVKLMKHQLFFNEFYALQNVSFRVEPGESVALIGRNGSGKSTMLKLIAGVMYPTTGSVTVNGEIAPLIELGAGFDLDLTARENVELAAEICRDPLDADTVLDEVGLADRKNNFPAQLSGGEQQRVSIARALAKNPKILLCDEPTGALDYKTGKQVLALLQATCRRQGRTVIVITHNSALAAMADRVIRINSGRVVDQTVNPAPTPVERIEW